MKIKTFGSRCITSQIDRIENGFRELGYEVLPSFEEGNVDLIYCNDIGCSNEAYEYSQRYAGVYIQTVLDFPEHLSNFEEVKWNISNTLQRADAVCVISNFVKSQAERYANIKNPHLIYQPIKPVMRIPNYTPKTGHRWGLFGRNQDPNKRSDLFLSAMQSLNKLHDILVVGEGFSGLHSTGYLDDYWLNVAYNEIDFIFCGTKICGLELTPIEAIVCGKIPLILSDATVAKEFGYPSVEPDIKSIVNAISELENRTGYYLEWMDFLKDKKPFFSQEFRPVVVAEKIILANDRFKEAKE